MKKMVEFHVSKQKRTENTEQFVRFMQNSDEEEEEAEEEIEEEESK